MEVELVKVMNREKVANTIHSILDSGIEMLQKTELEPSDFSKLKVIRVMGTALNSGVALIQQETAQLRMQIVVERMKQLGYPNTKEEAKQVTA